MNNQILAIFSLIPLYLAGLSGVLEFNNETFDMFIGVGMFIFTTWAGIRLYNIN